jgi:ubiquinone biosynthesis protein UbiJ
MRAAAALANHLLRDDPWVHSELVEHAGKTLRVGQPPVAFALRIAADGTFEALAEAPAVYDLELTLPVAALPTVLAGRDGFARRLEARGDERLALTLREIAAAGPWFLERELARWLGPIPAQRCIDLARALAAWPAYAAEHLGANVTSYLVEEQSALVKASQLGEFTAAVGRLRDEVARLEARIDQATVFTDKKHGRAY